MRFGGNFGGNCRKAHRDTLENPVTYGVSSIPPAPSLSTETDLAHEPLSLETAHRAMQNCGQVFRYAVATGWAERDPMGDLRGALRPRRYHLA